MNDAKKLKRIAAIIESVDLRCQWADGPVTKTLDEMRQSEIQEIYDLASGLGEEPTKHDVATKKDKYAHPENCECPYCKPAEGTFSYQYTRFGKLDLKYAGIIFKGNDVTSQIPQDEWVVFRAKDNALVDTLKFYLGKCQTLECEDEHIQGILDLLGRVRTWRQANPDKCKNPDTYVDELIFDALEEKIRFPVCDYKCELTKDAGPVIDPECPVHGLKQRYLCQACTHIGHWIDFKNNFSVSGEFLECPLCKSTSITKDTTQTRKELMSAKRTYVCGNCNHEGPQKNFFKAIGAYGDWDKKWSCPKCHSLDVIDITEVK